MERAAVAAGFAEDREERAGAFHVHDFLPRRGHVCREDEQRAAIDIQLEPRGQMDARIGRVRYVEHVGRPDGKAADEDELIKALDVVFRKMLRRARAVQLRRGIL